LKVILADRLAVSGLSKRFGSLQALDDLSLSLDRGEIVGFVGSNGAGKSTTMRMIMGLDKPTSGKVTVNGHPTGSCRPPVRETPRTPIKTPKKRNAKLPTFTNR